MFPTQKPGSSNPLRAGPSQTSHIEKRPHPPSSDDEQTAPKHPRPAEAITRSALSHRLHGQLARTAPAPIPLLLGPYEVSKRIADNDTSSNSPVYRVATPGSSEPLAAKTVGKADERPAGAAPVGPFDHSVRQYLKIGAHPNLNRIHGTGWITVDGVEKDAMIMDAGDMSLHRALDVLERARANGDLSDHAYFGVALPYVARALIGGAAHCAAAGVEHYDMQDVNVLMFKDGRPPQLLDLDNSIDHEQTAQGDWPDEEVKAGNPFARMYPKDGQDIAGILRLAANQATEHGEGLDTPGPRSPELASLERLLARANPRQLPPSAPQAHDFAFLTLGSDAQAAQLLRPLLKDVET